MWVWFDFEEFSLLDDFLCKFGCGFCLFLKNFHFLLGCLIILMQFLIWVNDFILGCSQFWCNFFYVGLLWFSRILIGLCCAYANSDVSHSSEGFLSVLSLIFGAFLLFFELLDLLMLFIQTPRWGVWSFFFSLFGIFFDQIVISSVEPYETCLFLHANADVWFDYVINHNFILRTEKFASFCLNC